MGMALTVDQLPNDLDKVKRIAVNYAEESEWLREELRLLRAKIFGQSSERWTGPKGDLLLFESEAAEEGQRKSPPEVTVPEHKRRKTGRQPIPSYLPRKPIVYDVPEAEKVCGCGKHKVHIGDEVSEQLEYQPASIYVIEHVRPKYACRDCEGVDDPGRPTVSIAPVPPQILPKALAGPGLLAHLICGKFVDAIPFYRQESQLARLGVELGRATMCNWAIALAHACEPLYKLLKKESLSGPLVNADESTLQVVGKKGQFATKDGYMWVFVGGTPGRLAVVFVYSPTRSGKVAVEYLMGYQGGVQTDGYSGYDFLDEMPGIEHYGCWSHARRGFTDVQKASGNLRAVDPLKGGVADQVIEHVRLMYAVEASAREKKLSPEQIVELRQELAKPQVELIMKRLEEVKDEIPPKSRLGKAVQYTLGQKARLERYLNNGHVRPDNNLPENKFRPFVVGRKNWLFSGSPEGAKASATLYSLVETAKANGLEPYRYLRYIFEQLPLARTTEDHRALLPQYLDRTRLGLSP
jgi:transposase